MSLPLPAAMRLPDADDFQPLGPRLRLAQERTECVRARRAAADRLLAFRSENHGDADIGCLHDMRRAQSRSGLSTLLDAQQQVEAQVSRQQAPPQTIAEIAEFAAKADMTQVSRQQAQVIALHQSVEAMFKEVVGAVMKQALTGGTGLLTIGVDPGQPGGDLPVSLIRQGDTLIIPPTKSEIRDYFARLARGQLTAKEIEEFEPRLRAHRRVKEFARHC